MFHAALQVRPADVTERWGVDVRLALCQLQVSGDKPANLAKVSAGVEQAAREGARLVVFPEATMHYFGAPIDPLAPIAERLDGPFVTTLQRLGRAHHAWILAGMFEYVDGDTRVYNTLVLVNDEGELVDTYRKIHLYDAFGYQESSRVAAGDGRTLLFEVDGVRFGALTCYDLRFPELCRFLASSGAQVLLLPTAWLHGALKELHLETLIRARAIENTVYVAAADQCGPGYTGNSALIDPQGTIVAGLAEVEGTVVATVSTDRIDAVRVTNPSLSNMRPDLYARWLEATASPSGTR